MDFKSEILAVAGNLGLTADEFDSVGIYEWPEIMKKIETKFVIRRNSNTKFNWWWEDLKGEQVAKAFPEDNGWTYLAQLVDKNEKVWFVGCNSKNDATKFWLFQGYVEPIQKVLSEMYSFEYYLISRKYEWMLCENHHGVMIGLGSIMDRLEGLELASKW